MGADVNQADNNGYTPLMLAAVVGNVNIVRVLLEGGAKVDQAKADQNKADLTHYSEDLSTPAWGEEGASFAKTALTGAAGGGYGDVVRVLLEWGADPDNEIVINTYKYPKEIREIFKEFRAERLLMQKAKIKAARA